jgi:N utilization substance protein B
MALHRRKAREVALKALYEIEIGHAPTALAVRQTLEEAELPEELAAYAQRVTEGVRANLAQIDDLLEARLNEYSLDRVAAVDRNLLRLATYELYHEPAVPPAVSIDEAVELAKKYSTAESGKFVNGVLGRILSESPKATWDPALAPAEEIPAVAVVEEVEVEVVEVEPEEAERLSKVGGWTLRTRETEGERPA